MHIHGGDAAVVIGLVIVDALVSVYAGGIGCDIVFALGCYDRALYGYHGIQYMEEPIFPGALILYSQDIITEA